MAKDKSSSKAAAAPVTSKPLESVKAGRVTKPGKSSKAVPESKKKQREPSPESSNVESDGTSDSSASSDDESDSDQEVDSKIAAKGDKNMKDDSSSASDSDSSDDEDDAEPKKAEIIKVNGNAKVNGKVEDSVTKANGKVEDDESASSSGSSDSDSDSDSGSESGAEAGISAEAGAERAADDSSSASSSEDEAEAPTAKVAEAPKKRKAEAPVEQTPKKARVNSNEGQGDAVGNLFIGNLSWNVDEEWLTRAFEEFGEIKGVRVITDRDSGRSKGFGYVEFTEVDCAKQALETMNGELLDGRNIRVDYSTPRPPKTNDGYTPQQRSADRAQRYGDAPKQPSKTLFVGNVSFNADESMLTELFQDHGTITAVRLPTDRETGSLKGFGYVEFTSIEEAQSAFDALQGTPIEGRSIRLDFAGERSNNNDSPRGGAWTRGAPRGGGRGGFGDRGGRGGFNDRGRGRGGARGGRGGTTNRGGFGDFSGKKMTF